MTGLSDDAWEGFFSPAPGLSLVILKQVAIEAFRSKHKTEDQEKKGDSFKCGQRGRITESIAEQKFLAEKGEFELAKYRL